MRNGGLCLERPGLCGEGATGGQRSQCRGSGDQRLVDAI